MTTSRLRLLALSMLVGVACPACVIDDIDLSCRRFPCAEGWVCETARDECVPSVLADAGDASLPDGGRDGGRDAGRDGGIDAGPPPPYCDTIPDAIFCDDFETGDLRRWDTVGTPDGGRPLVSPSVGRTGAKGLRITSSGTEPMRIAATIDAPDVTELWFSASVRMYADSTGTLDVFELSAADAGSITGQMVPGSGMFRVRVADTAGAVEAESRERRWNIGPWVCVQAHVIRGVSGSAEVFMISSQAAALGGVSTDFGAPYDGFSIALAPGSDVDLDDVVWSTTQTACPLP